MSEHSGERSDPGVLPLAASEAGSLVPRASASSPPVAEPLRAYALPAEDEAHFWDHWQVIVRHRWTVIAFLLVSVIIGTVWTFTAPPVFRATAVLKIEKDEPRVLKFEEVVKADPQPDYYQTQHKILESRALARRVVAALQLDQHPEFVAVAGAPGWAASAEAWTRTKLVEWVPVPPPPAPSDSEDLIAESPLTRDFSARLSVEPVRNARLVKVSFESRYSDLAARVPNAVAEAFIAQQLDQKIAATRYATQFLAQQMEEAREKLEAAEKKLNEFLRSNDILFVAPDKLGERQDLVTQQLSVLSDALLKARTERITRESLRAQALDRDGDSLPAVLQNPLIARLKGDVVSLEGQYRKLGQTFKPEYPQMRALAENIAELRRQLRAETARVLDGLDAEHGAAVRNEQALQKAVDAQRQQAARLGSQLAPYNLLRRDVETSRELYTSLLTRLKETQISSALLTSTTTIVDRAEVPAAPSRPRKALNMLIASLIGVVGGVGLAFVFEYLDTSIRDPKAVEALLRVPTLGLVPSQHAVADRRTRRRRLAADEADDRPFALAAHAEAGSLIAEAFRNLRTSLLYSNPDQPPRTLMVTSIHTEDGKTSLATNLAITLSQLGTGEILLIDADMRRPQLHDLLQVEPAPGLSTFLTGQAELPEVITPTMIPRLHVIPAGRVPVNPAELMGSRRLGQALDVLQERFTHIVLDTPPLFGVSDATILATRVEGVILVLRNGHAGRDAAQRAVKLLASVRARLLGVVLNDVSVRAGGYYGYYA